MKKLFVFWEMKLFSFKLKNSCFLEYTFRIFYHCFFGCFHFFIFSFLLNIFECFHRCLHLFTLLFLHCCCCTASATDLRDRFLSYTSSCIYQGFSEISSPALKVAGLPTGFQNTDSAHWSVWITQCSATIW